MLPHLRRLPERVDRILTLTARGELRTRSVIDEDGGRILRTLANRLLLVFAGASFLTTSAWLLPLPRTDHASPGRPGCTRRSATADCCSAPCSCCGWSAPSPGTARHDAPPRPPPRTVATATAVQFDDVPPGERYYRHPGDVIRMVVWALIIVALAIFIELAEGSERGRPRRHRRRRRPDPGHRPGAGRDDRPGRRHPRPAPDRGVAGVPPPLASIGPPDPRCGSRLRRFVLLDAGVGVPGPVAEALDDDFWLIPARFPSPAVLAGAAAAGTVGKPWLPRAWRRSRRPCGACARRWRDPHRRHRRPRRGAPGGLPSAPSSARPCWSARRTQPTSHPARRG